MPNSAKMHFGYFWETKAKLQKMNQNLKTVVFKDQIRDRNLNSIEVLAKNVTNGIFLSLYQDFQTLHLDAKMVMMRAAAKPNMGSTGALCSLMYLGEHFWSFNSFEQHGTAWPQDMPLIYLYLIFKHLYFTKLIF